jgi:hypothetical protein
MAVQTAVITQRELQEIHDLEEDLRTKQAELDRMKDNVKTLLFAHATVEFGRYDAKLAFKKMRNVPWKKVLIDELGFDFAESIRITFPGVTRCELLVIEHAIPPLWKERSDDTGKIQ